MGTVKYNAQVSLSASTYNTALAFPSVLDVPPASDTATGISRIHTKGVNRLVVKFAGTDAANETFGYQIIGLSKTVYNTQGSAYYVPIRIGSGVATLGAKTYGATGASLGTAATLWVDTITDTATKSPYMTVFSPANDEVAEIVVDCGPFDYIYIQGSRDSATAASFSIITQIYDSISANTNIEDLTLTGTGLALASNQSTEIAEVQKLTSAPVEKTPVAFTKTVTTPSTAEKLIASETFCRGFTIQAKKVSADNTGNVFIGTSTLDKGSAELFELTKGQSANYECPFGTKLDLSDIYIDADNAADGVVGWYIPV